MIQPAEACDAVPARLLRAVLQEKMKFGIDRYVGDWASGDGLRLRIDKVSKRVAKVSICDSDGNPLCRPYWDGKPMIDMKADYDDYMGEFVVQLWESDRGFSLHLDHQLSDRLIDLDEEVLSPAISQREEDTFLDQFHSLFGRLDYYKRTKTQNQLPDDTARKLADHQH